MFCVSLLLGCRPAEVCGLCDDDLINEYQEITIHRTLDKDGNTNDTKTTGSIRALYLPDKLYCIIKDTQTRKLQLKSYHPDYQHDFLFTTVKGRPVNPNRYSMYFRKALKSLTIRKLNPCHWSHYIIVVIHLQRTTMNVAKVTRCYLILWEIAQRRLYNHTPTLDVGNQTRQLLGMLKKYFKNFLKNFLKTTQHDTRKLKSTETA